MRKIVYFLFIVFFIFSCGGSSGGGSNNIKKNILIFFNTNNIAYKSFLEGLKTKLKMTNIVESKYSGTDCSSGGFTYLKKDTDSGIEIKLYANIALKIKCTEIDFSNTAFTGSNNYLVTFDILKDL